jgi:hypothetical protein
MKLTRTFMSRSEVDKSPQDVVDVLVGIVFGRDDRVEFWAKRSRPVSSSISRSASSRVQYDQGTHVHTIPKLLLTLQRSRSRFHVCFCAHPTLHCNFQSRAEWILRRGLVRSSPVQSSTNQCKPDRLMLACVRACAGKSIVYCGVE